MSRFFATGDTESESSQESSDEEVKPSTTRTQFKKSQFMFSDDEDDEKRVVRSQKDKRNDELKDIIRTLRNSQKIRDVSKAQTVFETLQKAYSKAKTVVAQEGGAPPKYYIMALVEMEDFVQKLWDDRDAKQKLSKINAKALAALKQKIKKYNKEFETGIAHCRDNPDLYEEDGESEAEEEDDEVKSEEDSDDDDKDQPLEEIEDVAKSLPPIKPKDGVDDDGSSDDDSIDWDMSDTSTSSSDSEGETRERVAGEYPYTAEYFLKKKPVAGESVGRVRKVREKKEKKQEDVDYDSENDDSKSWQTVNRQKAGLLLSGKDKMQLLFGKDKVELDGKLLAQKRNELKLGRGKKGTNKMEQLDLLKYLLDLVNEANLDPSVSLGITLRVYLDVLEGCFDVPTGAAAMKEEVWKVCLVYMDKVITKLTENPTFILDENVPDDKERYIDPDSPPQLHGSLLSYVEKMDDEYTKILQACDAHSPEYLDKLKDEHEVTRLMERAQEYIEGRQSSEKGSELCRIYMRRIDHLYYKVDRSSYNKSEDEATTDSIQSNSNELISKFAKFIYNYKGVDLGPIKTRAVLCHIYYHAIHDNWFKARDLMLMTHLQEGISHADVNTQILYNRTIVQLGMCAFRHGRIKDAHDVLMDMHSPPRPKEAKELAKELLAQGLNPRQERTPEQEKQERRRQMPFHMHINLELMECVYLTSAMLLEIPYMASTSTEGRRRMISKGFYHQLKNHEKQPLVGPPETMREHIVAAANAMKTGDWRKCRDYILDIKIWNLFINVDQVKEMLSQKVQEETLRTYVFSYSEIYDTLSLLKLSKMFELPLSSVHSIVSKMIIKEELLASLDEPTQSVVLHHTSPTTLQSLSFVLAEKIGSVADHNEELLKVKQGPGGTWMIGSSQSGLTSMSSTKPWGNRRRAAQ